MNRPASRRERAESLIGRSISGRYRLESLLAIGGMAWVYLGEHIHMRKRVAVKVLPPDTEGFAQLAARFEHEAMVGAHVEHPNVASATDFGWLEDGSAFLVLEYVPGVTLRALLGRGRLAPERAYAIARQIAAALTACHALGIVHRDLKPLNVMVDEARGDRVKLIDFGLARVSLERISMLDTVTRPPPDEGDDDATVRNLTFQGIVFGTVAYMPPEIALGMDAVDERSDLYSLGVVLYEMLSGVLPFDRSEPAELLLQKREEPPPPVALRAPSVRVPPLLEAVALRLLQPHPRARFQTAAQLVDALDAALADPAMGHVTLPPPPGQPSAPTLRVMPPVLKPDEPQAPRRTSWPRRAASLVAAAAVIALAIAAFDRNFARLEAEPPVASSEAAATARALTEAGREALRRRAEERSAQITAVRASLEEAHARRAWGEAGERLLELVTLDPALVAAELSDLAVMVAVFVEFEERPVSDRLFEVLAHHAGPAGLDVLFSIMSEKGGSAAAERAARILSDPDVVARAPAPLQVALAVRKARCGDKPSLFERAAAEGDERALVYLERLRSARCDPRIGECCFHGSRSLARAIRGLRRRLDASN